MKLRWIQSCHSLMSWVLGLTILSTAFVEANTYFELRTKIFDQNCLVCHGANGVARGGLDLTQFAQAKELASLILELTQSQEMPPGNRTKLSNEEIFLIESWIKAGMPEGSEAPPEPPPPPKLEAKYASLNALIFTPMCVQCHSKGGVMEELPLDTLQSFNNRRIVDFRRPEKSELIEVLRSGEMPDPMSNQRRLTRKEINTIQEWIEARLPE